MPWPEYDKAEDVPEAFRSEYELRDGKYRAKIEDVTGLKNSLTAARKEREAEKAAREKAEQEAAARLQELEAAKKGISAEQLAQIRKDAEESVTKRFSGDIERLTNENAEFKKRDEQRTRLALKDQVQKIALDPKKTGGSPVRGERFEKWWSLNGDLFEFGPDGVTPIVKGAAGKDINMFIGTDLKADVPEFYAGTKADGGGAPGAGAGTAPGGGKVDEKSLFGNPEQILAQQYAADAAGG